MRTFFAQPSVAEERERMLRSRAREWMRDGAITDEQRRSIDEACPSPWKHSGMIVGALFFVLTLIGIVALFWLCELMDVPKGFTTMVISIAAAELLIYALHFWSTGIESALWIGGLFAFIFGLPSEGKPEALLVFALAAALSGARLRNALFGALAAILLVAYVAVKTHGWWPPVVVALVIAIAAALALRREWRRPSNDLLFAALAVMMPLAGYIAAVVELRFPLPCRRIMSQLSTAGDVRLALLYVGTAVIFLVLAIPRRDRATLIAGALSIGISAYEVRTLFHWPVEAQLMTAGALLVAIAWTLSRLLRGRTRGFVITPTSLTRYDEAMQIAGAITVASPAQTPTTPQRESGGGSFGGAGASGDF